MLGAKVYEIDVQPDSKIVHVHIPKTAGTTFNTILESLVWGMRRCHIWHLPELINLELEELQEYQFYIGHFGYSLFSDIIFPKGFIGLTFLRDSFSRTVSLFRFIYQQFKQGELIERDAAYNANKKQDAKLAELVAAVISDEKHEININAFLDFLKNSHYDLTRNVINFQTGVMGTTSYTYKTLFDSIRSFLTTGHVSNLSLFEDLQLNMHSKSRQIAQITFMSLVLAKSRLKKMAFLGITERFQDSIFLLCYTFGWRPILNRLHLNATAKLNDTAKENPEVSYLIKKHLTLDIQLYRFATKIFQQRFNEMSRTLLKRYGQKKHKASVIPIPEDIMMELLEEHYIQRRNKRWQAKKAIEDANEFYFIPSMFVEGPFGWYPPEVSEAHGVFRWSGPESNSGFDLPRPWGKDIHITFCLLAAINIENIINLSLTANGIQVDLRFTNDSTGRLIFSGLIPSEATFDPFIRLIFSVPQTLSPYSLDHDTQDFRELGIALNWVKLQGSVSSS